MNKERIDKIISTSLNIPRNMAKLQIRRGKVKVDGVVCRDPSLHFDANSCEIEYKGEKISGKELKCSGIDINAEGAYTAKKIFLKKEQ